MSELRLFRVRDDAVEQLHGSAVALEKSLQTLIERHAETLLGVRVLASEYATTKSHGGRIDTLGIDESGSPVIVEYKRAQNENVINQGLFYLNWLLDHRADFKLLVLDKLGREAADGIGWSGPRLICIAGDFTKYDQHAIQQMPGNIDLVRYRRYGDDLLLLEQFASSAAELAGAKATKKVVALTAAPPVAVGGFSGGDDVEASGPKPEGIQKLDQCSTEVRDWYETMRSYARALSDGVHEHTASDYVTFRGLKTFAYVRFRPTKSKIVVDLNLSAAAASASPDVVKVSKSHWPRIEIDSAEDMQRVLPLIAESYQRT